jgi:glucosamine-6-phosphate deaminase
MRVIDVRHSREFAVAAADWVDAHVCDRPQSVLALPTGNTPIGMYAELVARCRRNALHLEGVRVFNLDEYCGVAASNPHSYGAFMQRHLIEPAAITPAHVRLLRGDAEDLHEECLRYDEALLEHGGIDLCVLGLGVNGHIAFNEPGTAWDQRTHVARLSHATRATHAAQATSPWRIPPFGITMGIRTLLESRHVLLLIAGDQKRAARDAFHAGVKDSAWPVTSLCGHPNLTTIELCAPEGSR